MTNLYKIEFAPAAQRQIKKLSAYVQKTILKKIELLQINPRPSSIKKLAGLDNLYRLRMGDYRVIYTINDRILVVLIVKIGDRKEVYRNL